MPPVRRPGPVVALIVLALGVLAPMSRAAEAPPNPLKSVQQWSVAVKLHITGTSSRTTRAGESRDKTISRTVEAITSLRLSAAQAVMIDVYNRAKSEAPEAAALLAAQGGDVTVDRWQFLTDPKLPDQTTLLTVDDREHGVDPSDREGGGPPQVWDRNACGRVSRTTRNDCTLVMDFGHQTFDLTMNWDDRMAVRTSDPRRSGLPQSNPIYVSRFQLREKDVPFSPDSGRVIHGSRPLGADELKALADAVGVKPLSGTLTWVFTPSPPEPLELIVDIPDYDSWVPEAGNVTDAPGPRPLTVRAHVQRRDGGPVTDTAQQITFDLLDVSREPGVALNWPTAGGDSPDLGFAPGGDVVAVDNNRLAAKTQHPGNEAEVTIQCFDWAAFGGLTVEAVTQSGQHLIGKLQGQAEAGYIRLPKRAADSAIADAWKQANSIRGADTDDLDDTPVGNGHKGDGLSLYEEYRGFYVAGRHVRSDPTQKDLFVRNRAQGGPFAAGIALFQTLTHIVVHPDLAEGEIKDRVINFNHGHAHRVDQHGIIIAQPGTGFAAAAPGQPKLQRMFYARLVDGAQPPGTPKDIEAIESTDDVYSTQENLVPNVVHELLHCCRVAHHGEDDPEIQIEIKPDPKTGALAAYMRRYVNGNLANFEMRVTLLNLDGTPTPLTRAAVHPHLVLGQKGGRYSGQEDCVMRYHNADFLRDSKRSNVLYVITGKDHGGTALCGSSKGTGVNAPDPGDPLRPWFGNARRGNCAGQICVSDER